MKKLLGLVFGIIIAAAAAAAAQGTTGTIAGRLVDTQGLPIPGATISVIGTQGTRTTVTDGEGRFTVPFLAPESYAIRAELPGFETVSRSAIQVRLGQTADLPLTMRVGGVNESVVVKADSGLVDTTSAAIGSNLDSDTLARLPVGRRFSDTLYLTPGVSTGGAVGVANPSVEGSSGLENQYVIDGVNITNGGFGALGSYSVVFGSLGNGTPFDFMQEVQVRTGGYEAEFGQATGGVINVVTKSGSNQVRGSAFGYARPQRLESKYDTVQTIEGTVNVIGNSLSDAGGTIGGPLLHDRLFYFAAIDPQWQTTTFVAPDGFPLQALGGVDRDRRLTNYAAKGTWQATAAHHIDASFFGDPAIGDRGPQRSGALLSQQTTAYSSLEYGGHNQTVRYNGVVTPRVLVEASVGRALNRIVEAPSVDEWRIRDNRVTPRVITGGLGFFEQGNRSDSWQFQAKATNLVGAHQIRYGVDYQHVDFSQLIQNTGPTFTAPNGQQTATGAVIDIFPDTNFDQIYHVASASLTSARPTSQHYAAVFLEDEWKIGGALTVKPGVRYEQETLAGTLVDDFALKGNWAPRIGVVWDPTRRGVAKVFGNFGRYYARVPNDLAARALSGDASITADYFDANLTRPVPDGILTTNPITGKTTTTHFALLGGNADAIDPRAKLSYYNEWIAGAEYTLVHGLNVGARFIHRDIGRVLEDVQAYPIVAASAGLPGAATADYLLTNPGPQTPVIQDLPGFTVAFEAPVHDYNAVEVSAQKRFSGRWALTSSYRWSRLTGNFEGFFRNDNGQSDPGITSLYDYPTDDPSYTAVGVPEFGYTGDIRFLGKAGEGPLPLDRTHDVKLFASYAFRTGLNVSAGLEIESGAPLTAFAAHPIYGGGGEIPLTVRGAGFETSEGFRTRTPWTKPVSAGASYDLRVGARTLRLSADVFNVFNAQTALEYASFSELGFNTPNADFGRAGVSNNLGGQQFATPRQVRVGVRFEF
ncbi:MAG TPA: TonB-dependent receptor [Vicinamibacterales bacterium]|nr:TonB-dependent receptor [Vicinamibacterales bacterium]